MIFSLFFYGNFTKGKRRDDSSRRNKPKFRPHIYDMRRKIAQPFSSSVCAQFTRSNGFPRFCASSSTILYLMRHFAKYFLFQKNFLTVRFFNTSSYFSLLNDTGSNVATRAVPAATPWRKISSIGAPCIS